MNNISEITTVTALKILQSKDVKRTRKRAKVQVKEELVVLAVKLHVVYHIVSQRTTDSCSQNLARHVTEEQGGLESLASSPCITQAYSPESISIC